MNKLKAEAEKKPAIGRTCGGNPGRWNCQGEGLERTQQWCILGHEECPAGQCARRRRKCRRVERWVGQDDLGLCGP